MHGQQNDKYTAMHGQQNIKTLLRRFLLTYKSNLLLQLIVLFLLNAAGQFWTIISSNKTLHFPTNA